MRNPRRQPICQHKETTMDMPINQLGHSVAETIATISRQIWDAKYRLKA